MAADRHGDEASRARCMVAARCGSKALTALTLRNDLCGSFVRFAKRKHRNL
jgi:hypothetical protein